MKLLCPNCATELEADEELPEAIACPACAVENPATAFVPVSPPLPPPPLPRQLTAAAAPVAAPVPVNRKPVGGGAVVRAFGLLVLALGIVVGLFALFMGTAHNETHNIGLISERATVALAGLALIVLGLGLHIIGQLDLTNAHLARLCDSDHR